MAVTRNGGTMADAGSVSRIYQRKGVVEVPREQDGRTVTEDELLEVTLEAGPEDVIDLGDGFVIECDPNDVVEIRKAVQAAGLDYDVAEVRFVADYETPLDAADGAKLEQIIDVLEDCDDVQNIYHNAQLPEDDD